MENLVIGLNTQFVVYPVVEVFNIGRENVTLLFLNMVEKTVMVHRVKIVLVGKPNAQVDSESFIFTRNYLRYLSSPPKNLDNLDQAKRKKNEILTKINQENCAYADTFNSSYFDPISLVYLSVFFS